MSQYRTPTAYVLGVLVLLAVIVLTTPNGGTHARWSATAQSEVPTMTTGRIGFEIAAVEGEGAATLTSTSGFDVRYRPVQVSLVDSAGRSVAAPAGMRFAYRTGAACDDGAAPAEWTAAAPGGSAPVGVDGGTRAPLEHDRPAGLCLTVSTDAVAVDALRALDAKVLQVVTTVEASTLGDGTWSTTRSWTVPFTVEAPPVEQPPVTAPDRPTAQDAARCGADNSAAQLRWSWTGGPGVPAVVRWEVRVRPVGTAEASTPVKTVTSSTAREARISAAELLGTNHSSSQDYQVLVRAVFADTGTSSVDSVYAWTVKAPGKSGHINCEGLPS
ncbi:hypothetical protein [Kocuria rosea]|uniref:Uncharacterized protein n=1 Tax=Kocuria rosea TaxID=1275 RepID=A0A4R5Y3M0_KOCRO|nr:hypothetical protein [Kocuria rosea]TDL39033.1 hypothetical protein E2R59_15870 [Kocuria rosea]